jgi:hypothetical protein
LAPLLRGGPLSKDAVSRLVGRLREDFDTWRTRDFADEDTGLVDGAEAVNHVILASPQIESPERAVQKKFQIRGSTGPHLFLKMVKEETVDNRR